MFTHVFGYLATAIYLLVHTDPKNSARYVFTDFTNLSGWESSGVCFLDWPMDTHCLDTDEMVAGCLVHWRLDLGR